MRITLHTSIAEERYQIICGLVARDMERRQSWSDMADITDSESEVQEVGSLPLLRVPIMRNQSPLPRMRVELGNAVGDVRNLLQADFS